MVSEEFLKDVHWWSKFVIQYHRVSVMLVVDWSKPDEIMVNDTCLVAAGGWFNGNYFHCEFPNT